MHSPLEDIMVLQDFDTALNCKRAEVSAHTHEHCYIDTLAMLH